MKVIKADFKNTEKAIQLSIDNLASQGFTAQVNDGASYSAMLLKLIAPYMSSTPHPDELEEMLETGIIAWNMANVKATGYPGYDRMYSDTIRDADITKAGEKIVLKIMQAKAEQYAEHQNFIEDYEIYEDNDGMAHVNIISRTFEDFMNGFEEDEAELEAMQFEEGYINRNAILVKPTTAFWKWVKQHDDSFTMAAHPPGHTIYLIRETDSDKQTTTWLKKNFDKIFITELEGWFLLPELWPKKRTYKMFTEFFDVEYHSMIMDLEKEPVTKD